MRRLHALIVLTAWLLASGAQWDLVQGFAWGRMIATYSRTMPLAEAVRLTFTAENLCGVCTWVADASTRADGAGDDAGEEGPAPAALAKLPLATPPEHVLILGAAPALRWALVDRAPVDRGRAAPPTEPPRAA